PIEHSVLMTVTLSAAMVSCGSTFAPTSLPSSEGRKQVVRRKQRDARQCAPERAIELAGEIIWRAGVEQRDPRYVVIRAHEKALLAGQISHVPPGRAALDWANHPASRVVATAVGACSRATIGHLRDDLRTEDVRRTGAAVDAGQESQQIDGRRDP